MDCIYLPCFSGADRCVLSVLELDRRDPWLWLSWFVFPWEEILLSRLANDPCSALRKKCVINMYNRRKPMHINKYLSYCLCFDEVRSFVCRAWLVWTTVYGISFSCSSVMPVVSTNENSKCCFSSLGSHFLSFGEPDRELEMSFDTLIN